MSSTTIFEPLDPIIQKQLETRQDIMANKVTNQNPRMTYLNKACNVRLIPLVKDISTETDYKNFVFSNFTLKDSFFDTVSSFQDKKEKPYIDNFEVLTRSGNNIGATKIGNLTIIVPTKNQFNLIERYFRIGTPFLLEWGWGKYVTFNNPNDYSSNNLQFVNEENVLEDDLNDVDIEKEVIRLKTANQGNYEGGVFYITNFTTSIKNGDTDFYFEMNIRMVSKGDILNNLKNNDTNDDSPVDDNNIENLIKNDPIISFLKNLPEIDRLSRAIGLAGSEVGNEAIETILKERFSNFTPGDYVPDFSLTRLTFSTTRGAGVNRFGGDDGGDSSDPATTFSRPLSYIKLGAFLDNLSRIHESDKDFKYGFNRNLSKDREYILPNYPLVKDFDENSLFNPYKHFTSFNPFKFILPHFSLSTQTQKIDDILIRVEFLIEEISKLIKDDKNDLNNILKIILDTINNWTDGELDLIKYINEDKLADEIVSTKSEDNFGELFTLKLYGLGSIVESTEIDTTIDNKISSQVAIMMNGSSNFKTDSEAISLLKFNKNIRSRFNNDIGTPSAESPQVTASQILGEGSFVASNILNNNIASLRLNREFKTTLDKLEIGLKTFGNFQVKEGDQLVYKDGLDDDAPFTELLNLYKKFKQNYISFLTKSDLLDQIRGTPLFPIKIKTTLPGISGMKIGNRLKIEDIRLPEVYIEDKVYYVVTNIQNKVTNRYWTTFLDLSPQINTVIDSTKVVLPEGTLAPGSGVLSFVEVDFEKLLDVIRKLESGGIRFSGDGPIYDREGVTYIGPPLFSSEITSDNKKARGPYQLKPAATVDALQYLKETNKIPELLEKVGAIWLWKDTTNFNNIIDTISGSRRLARAYIERYQNTIDGGNAGARTYLRLLSLYKLGTSARFTGTFITAARKDGDAYRKYITDGRKFLQDLNVPNNQLNDTFIQRNILTNLPTLS